MKTRFQYSRKRSLSSPGRSAGPPNRLAAVDVELRAGTARALAAGLPEVLRARQQDDPLLGDAALLPELDRLRVGAEAELLVAAEDRHPDLPGVEAEAVERQLPGEVDRLPLEVVAEGEVAEHLEAGEMAGGAADLLDVGRPEAALGGGQPRRRRRLPAQVVGLERLHAGRRQQHAGVVGGGDQRCRRHPQVPPLLEERHVGLSDLLRIHGGQGYATRPRGPSDARRHRRGQAIVPWPTTRSPSQRTAVWPGAAARAGSSSSSSSRSQAPGPGTCAPPPTRQASGRAR